MTEKEITDWKTKIDLMSQHGMAHFQRFAEPGHPIFQNDTELPDYFKKRFELLGGMTPQISKDIGWERW